MRRRMTMRADLERNIETGKDGHNNPLPPNYAVLATIPCFVWSKTSTRLPPGERTANLEELRAGFPLGTDIRPDDRLAQVRKKTTGAVLYEGLIVDVEPQYKHTHLEVVLRRVD